LAEYLYEIEQVDKDAEKITLVMDNLGTRKPGALYETFKPEQAKALWDRFEFVYTPKHGSWLNMAEIELNVLMGQCLKRRIETIDEVTEQVKEWEKARNNRNAKINWRFNSKEARIKLKRLYPTFDD
jgi:transposase